MYTADERHEIHSGKRYLDYTEDDTFRAFRDKENPLSYESNYAVLKRVEASQDTFSRVELFFAGMDETPAKFRWRPDAVPLTRAMAFFERYGYEVAKQHMTFLHQTAQPDAGMRMADCRVLVKEGALSEAERAMAAAACSGDLPALALLEKQLAHGARGYFACNRAGVPVSCCFGEGYGEAFRLGHLFTPEPCRGQGCGARVLSFALADAARTGYTDLFALVPEDCTSRSLYERFGFTAEPRTVYWAVKGGLPQWLKNGIDAR